MASESSLLGLMNQLQSLESSMAVILMESAMKISALTDVNIFLLVETSSGRRFCGAPHLCSAYARATLSPVGNDVEMDVNVATSGVSERRILTPSADRGGGGGGGGGSGGCDGGLKNTSNHDENYQNFFEDSTEPDIDSPSGGSGSNHQVDLIHPHLRNPLASPSGDHNTFLTPTSVAPAGGGGGGDNHLLHRKRRFPPTPSSSALASFATPKRFQKDLAMDVKVELTEDLDAETGLLMSKKRDDNNEDEEEEDDAVGEEPLDGDCEDDDIICDNYLPTPLVNSVSSELHGVQSVVDFNFPRQHLDGVDNFIADIQPHDETAAAAAQNNSSNDFYNGPHPWSNGSNHSSFATPHYLNFSSASIPTSTAASKRGAGIGLTGQRGPRGKPTGRATTRPAPTNHNRSVVPYSAPNPGQLNNVGGWDLAAFLSSNPKVQALQQIRDESIAEKHSTSNRLLHSVLYTVGRAIAENCAIKDKKNVEAKMFFNKIFELWWSQFPFLQELNSKGVKLQKGKKMLPLRGSVRETMQRYFGNTLDKVLQDLEQKQQQHLAIQGQMQPLAESIHQMHAHTESLHDAEIHLGLD